MRVLKTVAAMQLACKEIRAVTRSLGFVPTMGALHEGHLSLVRRARAECDSVVASIFVNPLQFGPTEDFDQYPRTFEADCAVLEGEGVEILFAPSVGEMYPSGAVTTVTVAGVGDRLDGASRPGHFTGVATVVAKLLHVVSADRAYFGKKDAAQLAVLRTMVRDLNFPVELVGCGIVRDGDGLALSSRNRYLSAVDRGRALVLRRVLLDMMWRISGGTWASDALYAAGLEILASEPHVRLDYLAIVDADTLLPVKEAKPGTLVAIAAYVGTTRLIDNFVVGSGDEL